MEKEYVIQIAQTIQEQLIGLTPMPVLMSWGIAEFAATIFKDLPALRIKVNGLLHTGYVIIALNGSDYYEVYLLKGKDAECVNEEVCYNELGVIVKTCSDICFTIRQKNCQMFVAKLHNILHPHNRMRFYHAHSVLSFPDFAVDTFLPQRFLR